MGNEISGMLLDFKTQLLNDFGDWNVEIINPEIEDTDNEQFWVFLSIVDLSPTPEDRGVFPLRMTLTLEAQVLWRYTSEETLEYLKPLDIAATLLAWAHKRTFACTDGVMIAEALVSVIAQNPFGDPEKAHIRYAAHWRVPLLIGREIDTYVDSSPPYPAYDIDVTPPIQQVYMNDEEVWNALDNAEDDIDATSFDDLRRNSPIWRTFYPTE